MSEVNVVLEVGKHERHVAAGSAGGRWSERNEPCAVKRLVQRLMGWDCAQVLVEGGWYQNLLVAGLRAGALPVVIINPPPVRELPDEPRQVLRALWVRREQLIEMLVMEHTRLERAPGRASSVCRRISTTWGRRSSQPPMTLIVRCATRHGGPALSCCAGRQASDRC